MKKSKHPESSKERQAKRRAALNKAAKSMGYPSWTKYETAVIAGKA